MAIIILRTIIIYASLLISMRVMGKRQMGELEISELVVAVVIADIAVIPLQDLGIPLINGLLPLIVLFCCETLITGLASKSIRLRIFLYGRPSILINHGTISQVEMHRNRFTIDELYEELRKQSITDISKIERAVLETSGTLNVILKANELPPTCAQMGINSSEDGIPVILINEGHILETNLKQIGKDLRWLNRFLSDRHIRHAQDVYLLSYQKNGTVYLSLKEY